MGVSWSSAAIEEAVRSNAVSKSAFKAIGRELRDPLGISRYKQARSSREIAHNTVVGAKRRYNANPKDASAKRDFQQASNNYYTASKKQLGATGRVVVGGAGLGAAGYGAKKEMDRRAYNRAVSPRQLPSLPPLPALPPLPPMQQAGAAQGSRQHG